MRIVAISIVALVLVGCLPEEPDQDPAVPAVSAESEEASQQYTLTGTVTEVDESAGTITVDHEDIGEWMPAMTMSFSYRGVEPEDLPEPGDYITATVNVEGTEYWLTDIGPSTPMVDDESEPSMEDPAADHADHMDME